MGTVISFPEIGRTAPASRAAAGRPESATVIILPVIRIERYVDDPEPEASGTSRRRRRRRATR
jgi:hypothetical protein